MAEKNFEIYEFWLGLIGMIDSDYHL